MRSKFIPILATCADSRGELAALRTADWARIASDDRGIKIITLGTGGAIIGTIARDTVQHTSITVATV